MKLHLAAVLVAVVAVVGLALGAVLDLRLLPAGPTFAPVALASPPAQFPDRQDEFLPHFSVTAEVNRLRGEGYTCQPQSYPLQGSHEMDCDAQQGIAFVGPTFYYDGDDEAVGILDSCSLDPPQSPVGPCQSQAASIVAQIFAGDPGQAQAATAWARTNMGSEGSTTLGGVFMQTSLDNGIMLQLSPAG